MIRVNENYVIQVDTLNYIPSVDKHKTTVKDGKEYPVYDVIGYYKDLTGAVAAVAGHMARTKLSEKDLSLVEAIKELNEINAEIKNIVKGIEE